MEVSSVLRYHLIKFANPASIACLIDAYFALEAMVSHSDMTRSMRGRTRWMVAEVSEDSSGYTSDVTYKAMSIPNIHRLRKHTCKTSFDNEMIFHSSDESL